MAAHRSVSLLICDDHKILTDALTTVVGLDPELEMVGPAVHDPQGAPSTSPPSSFPTSS